MEVIAEVHGLCCTPNSGQMSERRFCQSSASGSLRFISSSGLPIANATSMCKCDQSSLRLVIFVEWASNWGFVKILIMAYAISFGLHQILTT